MSDSTQAVAEGLDELERSLSALLSAFGAGLPDDDVVRSLSRDGERAFENLRLATDQMGGVLPAELVARAEAVLKLNAVASNLVVRSRDSLGVEIDRVSRAKAELKKQERKRSSDNLGRSCDIMG